MIPLAFPTVDNTVILASSINFTADGANLINGGATAIIEAPKGQNFNKLSITTSQIVSVFGGVS